MGKYKRLYKNVAEVTDDIIDRAVYILENWRPTKNCGLSKKESRAAYVGFALGLINAARMVDDGEFHLSDSGPIMVYDWLCATVAMYRDSGDDPSRLFSELGDDVSAVDEFLKAVSACDGDDGEDALDAFLLALARAIDEDARAIDEDARAIDEDE